MKLDGKIKQWRKALHRQGAFEDGHLEELESHLRDLIAQHVASGNSEEEAYKKATYEMGDFNVLGVENHKVHRNPKWNFLHIFLPSIIINSLKLSLRQIRKQTFYTFVNIGGLALGLTCCLFISYFVIHELSYDQQFDQSIYRVDHQNYTHDGDLRVDAGGPVMLGATIREEFPEVKSSVRFWRAYRPILKANDKVFEEQKLVFADEDALQMFDFELVHGNSRTALKGGNKILLSESMAIKYFGTKDVSGKAVSYNGYPGNEMEFLVSGVFKDLPTNTHFDFDFLASFETLKDWNTNWTSFKPVWTYVQLHGSSDVASFETKLQTIPQKYFPDRMDADTQFKFFLENIADIHLHSEAGRPMKPGGSKALINITVVIGVLILLMCCFNFINSSLAKAMERQKEIGVRKVLGASRGQLIYQIICETAVVICISLLIAVSLVFIFQNQFEMLTGIEFYWKDALTFDHLFVLLGIVISVIIMAGLYPAVVMSNTRILLALSKKSAPGHLNFGLRETLVLLQCAISGILIIGIIAVNDQLNYIKEKPTGVDMENLVVIPSSEKPQIFENELNNIPGVISYTYSQQLPVNDLAYDGRAIKLPGPDEQILFQSSRVSTNFINVYNIELLSGTDFNAYTVSDSNKFIINETGAELLGWNKNTALGKEILWSDIKGEVIGVTSDFHLSSVHEEIPPLILVPDYLQSSEFLTLKLDKSDMAATLEQVQNTWRTQNPDRPYSYFFLEDSYLDLRESDYTFSALIFVFAVIAIVISSLGLFALSAYTVEQKRKEIGIRKLLGSSVVQIFYKIGLPFILTASAALVVATPIALWLIDQWLGTFAYHTTIQPLSIIAAASLVIVIAILSVTKETLRASYVNPVQLLREE